MPIVRAVPCDRVIAKVFRDFRPNNSSWTSDAIEWIGEAINAIGAYYSYSELVMCLQVKGYSAPLPCKIEQLNGIKYRDMRLSRCDGVQNVDTCHHTSNLPMCKDECYSLNPSYIKTSFEEGELTLYYIGIPLDCNGFPLVPDEYEYMEALVWYIVSRMILRGHTLNGITFEYADARWEAFIPKARNSVDFPDIDDMELFMRNWNSLLLDTGKVRRFFNNLGGTLEEGNVFPSPVSSIAIAQTNA